jgi:hypothetical protein
MSSFDPTTLGGGPYQGFSTVQTQTGFRDSENVDIRKIVVNSWNKPNAVGRITTPQGTYGRITTPFRAVNNLGDFLGRMNYSCGGPNQVNPSRPGRRSLIGSIPQQCDASGIPAASCNVRFVADSSDYITFKKQQAINQNYNDLKDGGYQNSSYVNILASRRY